MPYNNQALHWYTIVIKVYSATDYKMFFSIYCANLSAKLVHLL